MITNFPVFVALFSFVFSFYPVSFMLGDWVLDIIKDLSKHISYSIDAVTLTLAYQGNLGPICLNDCYSNLYFNAGPVSRNQVVITKGGLGAD